MKCPYCGYKESKVIDSRPAEEGSSIRRRRECLSCAKRFTTYETVESLPMVVIKRDNSRQSFDRNKVLNGMLRACEKRPVAMADLEAAADEIEQIIQNSLDREVSTAQIGELVRGLPDGLETPCGEGGSRFSGGHQKSVSFMPSGFRIRSTMKSR